MLLRSITQFSKLMSKEMYGDYCGDFAKLRTIPFLFTEVFITF